MTKPLDERVRLAIEYFETPPYISDLAIKKSQILLNDLQDANGDYMDFHKQLKALTEFYTEE